MGDRKRNRLKEFDYSQCFWYFVTICVKDMITYLGKVENGKLILNEYGKIIEERIKWLQRQYKYAKIDSYVIMPNHIHAIIKIDTSIVGTTRELSLQIKIKSLSELIGALKTTSSKYIHRAGLSNFKWQRSFYDRIIRNESELYQIRKYIYQNPIRWDIEKLVPVNLKL